MKSIRRSLIVYFLFLMTAALGAVGWFSYRTTAESLRKRQSETHTLIEAQCDADTKEARDELDRHILRQAQTLANLSKSAFVHAEGQFAYAGMVGALAMPDGYLNFEAFWIQARNQQVAQSIFNWQPLSTHIDIGDRWIPEDEGNAAKEYFQTYRANGAPMQRSESMGDQQFRLARKLRFRVVPPNEFYDDVEMADGVMVRRVTMKSYVSGFSIRFARWPFHSSAIPNPYFPTKGPVRPPAGGFKGAGKGMKGGFAQPPRGPGVRTHYFIIQYAADLAPTEARIAAFKTRRDQQIANLAATIDGDLTDLRTRMFWIGAAALAALWIGGYVVICLGLSPLSKMSDAVSKVSSKDFHLPLESNQLPSELQPIAGTLVQTLERLQKAFTREKQAAADISHELRTPLAALMTTLDVALKKARTPEQYREILQDCQLSGKTMYLLVERLLTLARLDAGVDQYRPVEVDVTDLATQCADLIRPLAKAKDLKLQLNLPDLITTKTDPHKLREILTNLLGNAVEYNKPGGSIQLSAERTNGHVRFEVRDTGIGITPEAMAHIFERFYRADASRYADTPHAGLGLSIVKSYVDLMGGTIRVESSEQGTTFVVELPFVAPKPDLASAVKAEPALATK